MGKILSVCMALFLSLSSFTNIKAVENTIVNDEFSSLIEEKNTDSDNIEENSKEFSSSELADEESIQTEAELVVALSTAIDGDVLILQGGSTFQLTDSLKINTTILKNISFASSNESEVIILNADEKRHIEVISTNAIALTFDRVVLSGVSAGLGGISISNSAVGNVIDGLIVREAVFHSTTLNGVGFIHYVSRNGGSFVLKNSVFENNRTTATSRNWASFLYTDAINGEVTIDNVVFSKNELPHQLGAVIYAWNDNGKYIFTNNAIEDNKSQQGNAGLVYRGQQESDLFVDNSTFSRNQNGIGLSGAMRLRFDGTPTALISNSEFDDNFGHRGGGAIYTDVQSTSGNFTLDKVKFTNNKASRIEYNPETGEQLGLPSTGGAVALDDNNGTIDFNINNSIFVGNEATNGGALTIYGSNTGKGSKTTIDASVFDGNIADYQGGALALAYFPTVEISGFYTIKNSTIVNNIVTGREAGPGYNRGGNGGGIYFASILNYPNLIKLDTVTFDNNISQYPVIWNYKVAGTGGMDEIYTKNVVNTSFSKTSFEYISGFNNAYNGNDVYVPHNALVQFTASNNSEVVVNNYSEETFSYNMLLGAEMILPLEPKAEGYTFIGWFDEEDVQWDQETHLIETTTSLVGKWKKDIVEYQVAYQANGGSWTGIPNEVVETENWQYKFDENGITTEQINLVASGQSGLIPTIQPQHDGYLFLGWSVSENAIITLTETELDEQLASVSENINLYAIWAEEDIAKYSIIYDGNGNTGGIVPIDEVAYEYGAVVTILSGEPTKTGFIFQGWKNNGETFREGDTSTIGAVSKAITQHDIILVAVWSAEPAVPEEPTLPETGQNMTETVMGSMMLLTLSAGTMLITYRRKNDNQ